MALDIEKEKRTQAEFDRALRRPDRQFQRIIPPYYSVPDFRDGSTSSAMLALFAVDKSPRYQPQNVDGRVITFCNIFMWDWSIAMRAELPHFVDGKELVINQTIDRLRSGKEDGWHDCGQDDAHAMAKTGMPVIVTWYNPNRGPGHVAVVEPEKKLTVAQAGRICGYGLSLSAAFGAQRLSSLQYWYHV